MSQSNKPRYGKIILIPALITLGITLLRLGAEFMDLPAWLANRDPGGLGALIGISWLPPILGVYFALKLAGAPGKLWKNLLKTLFLYGLAARIPVIINYGTGDLRKLGHTLRCIRSGCLYGSYSFYEISEWGPDNPTRVLVNVLDCRFRYADGADCIADLFKIASALTRIFAVYLSGAVFFSGAGDAAQHAGKDEFVCGVQQVPVNQAP
jgi:hypothetical protein